MCIGFVIQYLPELDFNLINIVGMKGILYLKNYVYRNMIEMSETFVFLLHAQSFATY